MIAALAVLTLAAAGSLDVRDFGAKGDGATKDTAAIQRTIDAAAAAGGGEVRVPAGHYVSGSVFLRSNVDFHVEEGALLEASRDPKDYNAADVCPQNWASKAENTSGGHFFLAIEATNVTVRGKGVFDGSGVYFMTNGYDRARVGRTGRNGLGWVNEQDAILWRPGQMMYFVECDNLRLEGVTVRNAPYWSVFVHGCTHVTAKDLTIRSSRDPYVLNGDGLNLDCCRHVTVEGCDISTSDDALCLRADGQRLRRAPAETSDVTVRNCRLSSGQEAIRLGVGEGVVRDCRFSDIAIHDSVRGINLASTWFPSRGVDFIDISFTNVTAECRKAFLWLHRLKSREPEVRGITFTDVRARQGDSSYIWAWKGKPFKDIALRNVDLNGGLEVINVNGFRIEGGTVKPTPLSEKTLGERNRMLETCTEFIW